MAHRLLFIYRVGPSPDFITVDRRNCTGEQVDLMPQIFHRSTNTISRLSIFGALFLVLGLLWLGAAINRSSYVTEQNVARAQPVPFSHDHHVGGLGIDCRYCHTSVETAAFAGMPSTAICMNCHSQIWSTSEVLKPVRDSLSKPHADSLDAGAQSTRLRLLQSLDSYSKGVGCSSCHGAVDRMPLLWQAESLQMEWCLGCHRQPELHLRPREQVFNMNWRPAADQIARGRALMREYGVEGAAELTSCSTCHR